LSISIDHPLLGWAPLREIVVPRHSTVTTPALPCQVLWTPLSCVDCGGGGEEDGGGLFGAVEGPVPGPGAGPGPGFGPAGAGVGAADDGVELGVLLGEFGRDEPVEGFPGAADAGLEGRFFGACLLFGLSARLVCGAEVMGATSPIAGPVWVTTPWPAREITAHTSTAPTTTRTSQAEPART
jgi:hypothetical protein